MNLYIALRGAIYYSKFVFTCNTHCWLFRVNLSTDREPGVQLYNLILNQCIICNDSYHLIISVQVLCNTFDNGCRFVISTGHSLSGLCFHFVCDCGTVFCEEIKVTRVDSVQY